MHDLIHENPDDVVARITEILSLAIDVGTGLRVKGGEGVIDKKRLFNGPPVYLCWAGCSIGTDGFHCKRSMQKNYSSIRSTQDPRYTDNLIERQSVWWKRLLDVQRPYRWHIRRLDTGFTLDIGCGIGRHLMHLGGNGVGIDHNKTSVEIAKKRGLRVFTVEEFQDTEFNRSKTFDSLLMSHVAEHMKEGELVRLLNTYLSLLKPKGKVILITPQESGYKSDSTHVQFMDFDVLKRIIDKSGLVFLKSYSFPFPRFVGRLFKHNEFVCIGEKPAPT